MEQERAASIADAKAAQKSQYQASDYVLSGIGDVLHCTELLSEISQIGIKVCHSVLGVALVLLTATALYRITRRTKPTSMSNKNGGEMDEFLSQTQVSDYMFLGDTEYYKPFQPI
ncbi:PIR Superfamily Protein [Plasmodium ovale wallikeri]|uniref:PIR Superfamily Protein n=1 Tax=Plasmodium ovale wallikeri TaxID=864142 RepID=A0A1A9A517_PLAOA|nr:PIR Superfamily Protein [Plasmodium ovale wallikeri]SBT54090.1 PIR Superfamily Protein [Plasmodium ovale wallikeri]